jgi:hypothetical protein
LTIPTARALRASSPVQQQQQQQQQQFLWVNLSPPV